MSIERYTCGGVRIPPYEWPSGEWVKHSDHEAELAKVREERDADVAQAVRRCVEIAGARMLGPMERAQFATAHEIREAIRAEFPEAFK